MTTIEQLHKYISTVPDHFRDEPGVEPYALYMEYSVGLPGGAKIADLGTLQGLSALALSANPSVEVLSYDIDQSKNLVDDKDNITFILGNVFDHLDEILKCDLILVDIDPHDGIQEKRFFDILVEKQYRGVTLWDDIHHNLGMQNFWHKIKMPKEDLTERGHHSGTGLIVFN